MLSRLSRLSHLSRLVSALVGSALLAALLCSAWSAAPVAHAATVACGETITGKVVNTTTNTFSWTDLDQQNTNCTNPVSQLHDGAGVTQGAQYTVNFDLQNMAGSTASSFDAWIGFRRTDQYNKYSVHFLASTVEFRVRVNDVETTLGSTSYTTPLGSFAHLRLVMNGFTFTLSNRDTGAVILSVTDANQTFASGPTILFYVDGATFVCWDNVSGAPGLPA